MTNQNPIEESTNGGEITIGQNNGEIQISVAPFTRVQQESVERKLRMRIDADSITVTGEFSADEVEDLRELLAASWL